MKVNIYKNLKKAKIILIAVASIFATSCDSFLDVKPEGEIPSDQIFETSAGYESALFGVYGSMNSTILYGSILTHGLIDVLAQYYISPSNTYLENAQKYDYLYMDIERDLSSVWGEMYKNIANVNNVLINLEKKAPSSMEFYNIYKGEALGLRAFMHFDLLRLYTADIQRNPSADGIPYSVKFELSPSSFSSLAKLYDLIIADLLEAEELLAQDAQYFTYPKVNPPQPFLRDRETHFNLYAVQATLARVYLAKGDKINAAAYAKKVVDSQKFELMDKGEVGNALPAGVLYKKETIFGLYNPNYYTTVHDRFYTQTSYSSYIPRPDIEHFYRFEESGVDHRWSSFFLQPTTPQQNLRFVKLVDPYTLENRVYQRPEGSLDGINLIRMPEMYYILAESLLESDPATATAYFDQVLLSRGLDALGDRDVPLPLTLDRISAERYKELIGEGQTFFNMKRLNAAITNTQGVSIPASNQIYVWPIPNDEKEFNN